jgi:hypothetical protein
MRKKDMSVMANVEQVGRVSLNRFLLEVGHYGPDMVVVDAWPRISFRQFGMRSTRTVNMRKTPLHVWE